MQGELARQVRAVIDATCKVHGRFTHVGAAYAVAQRCDPEETDDNESVNPFLAKVVIQVGLEKRCLPRFSEANMSPTMSTTTIAVRLSRELTMLTVTP